ncbi:hypothetical protein FOG51_03989 [Hanseniaspora uvarum]|nr:hypothetical protein FOG51_03989 [Hanseniaspora uvarum]
MSLKRKLVDTENSLTDITDGNSFSSDKDEPQSKKAKHMSNDTISLNEDKESSEMLDDDLGIKAGYIKNLKLINFMCHEHFYIEFTPNLNFIIGNNGTGKSAILTAIAVGLGANASQAQRSGQLKGLIQHGKDKCSVTLTINNAGDFAYQPEVYGDEIILERTISQKHSSFRVKIDNKLQDLKSSHLKALLNYLGIRINNPMVFLTQDMAKKFLTAASKKEKYDNFAAANYFDYVYNSYNETEQNLASTAISLKMIKPNLDRLQKEAAEAKTTLNKVRDSKEMISKITLLKRYNSFLEVQEKYKEAKVMLEDLNRLREEIEQLVLIKESSVEEQTEDLIANKQVAEENISSITEELNTNQTIMNNHESEILELKALINSLKQDEKTSNRDFRTNTQMQKQVKKEYDIAAEQFAKSSDEKNKKLIEQKITIEKEINLLNEAYSTSNEKIASLVDQQNILRVEKEQKLRQVNGTIKEYMQILSSQKQSKTDVYESFGPNMKACLTEINSLVKNGQFSSPPIGPLGSLVTIKEEYEAEWAVLAQNRLSAQLKSFVVSNLRDKQLLQRTLAKYNMRNGFNFLIRSMNTFDYTKDIPKTAFGELKMTDVLDFANEQVKCVFVDLAGVHTLILGKDYEDGKSLSIKYPKNTVIAVTKENGYIATFLHSRGSAIVNRYVSKHITMKNQNKYLVKLKEELLSLQRELKNISTEYDKQIFELQEEINSIKNSQSTFRSDKRKLMEQLDIVTTELNSMQDSDKVDSLHNEVMRLEEVLRVTQSSLDNLRQELQESMSRLETKNDELSLCQAKHKELLAEMNEQTSLIQNINKNIHEVKLRIKSAAKEYEIKQKESDVLTEKLTARRNSLKEKKKFIEPYQADILSIKDSLSNDSKYQIEQRIKKLENHLNENSDFSMEDLADLELQALNAITKFKRERVNFKSFKSLLDRMHNLLHQKKLTYLNHQTDCFKETNAMFVKFMKYRGFVGNLSFQNPNALDASAMNTNIPISRNKGINGSALTEGELTIFARSREETETRDVDTLSGGEKSFAQMSLLLATWGVISSRVIALDEFDVFMDNVNREIGTKLIIESLKDRVQTQTVIITPQDITAIADNYINDPHIKIHKMTAIKRN